MNNPIILHTKSKEDRGITKPGISVTIEGLSNSSYKQKSKARRSRRNHFHSLNLKHNSERLFDQKRKIESWEPHMHRQQDLRTNKAWWYSIKSDNSNLYILIYLENVLPCAWKKKTTKVIQLILFS